jgi:hypothetical protein
VCSLLVVVGGGLRSPVMLSCTVLVPVLVSVAQLYSRCSLLWVVLWCACLLIALQGA